MIGPWLSAVGATAALLLAGLAAAERDRSRVLVRAGGGSVESPRPFRRGPWRDPRFAVPGCGALGWVVGSRLAGPPGAAIVAAGAAALPLLVRRRRYARHRRLIDQQLVDAVAVVASALRTGRSLPQAMELAGAEVGEPLGSTLTEAANRVRLGEALDTALQGWEERLGTPDARLVAGVLRLHRRTGGALASALDDLVRTLRARLRDDRELRALTAQARLSAAILGLLPLGFFLFLSVVSRRDIESAYRTTAGASAIAVGAALEGLAFLWIRRLLRVEPT